jgi:hypothetical protein
VEPLASDAAQSASAAQLSQGVGDALVSSSQASNLTAISNLLEIGELAVLEQAASLALSDQSEASTLLASQAGLGLSAASTDEGEVASDFAVAQGGQTSGVTESANLVDFVSAAYVSTFGVQEALQAGSFQGLQALTLQAFSVAGANLQDVAFASTSFSIYCIEGAGLQEGSGSAVLVFALGGAALAAGDALTGALAVPLSTTENAEASDTLSASSGLWAVVTEDSTAESLQALLSYVLDPRYVTSSGVRVYRVTRAQFDSIVSTRGRIFKVNL